MPEWTEEQRREFGEMWRRLRKQRGYSQWEVAQALDVSQSVISALERGPTMNMRFVDVARMCDFFGVPLADVCTLLGIGSHDVGSILPPSLRLATTQLSPKYRARLRWLVRVVLDGILAEEGRQL